MTKKEIVRQIAERIQETQLKTKEIVQLTFDAIVDTLIADRRIELRNFGVFEVKLRKPRKARNPRTNAHVEVPAKFVVTFKPGKEMEERVSKLMPTPADLARLARARSQPAAAASPQPNATPTPASAPTPVPTPTAASAAASSDGNGTPQTTPDSGPAPKKKRVRKAAQA